MSIYGEMLSMSGVPVSSPTSVFIGPARSRWSWLIIPSWLGSMLFHGLLGMAILSLSQLPACQHVRDSDGTGGDSFRQVGIRLLPPGPAGGTGGTEISNTPAGGDAAKTEVHQVQPLTAVPAVSDPLMAPSAAPSLSSTPPIPLSLPKPLQSVGMIGPGAPLRFSPGPGGSNMDHLVRPSLPGNGMGAGSRGTGGGTGGGNGTGGGGGTSFLGVQGIGKKFVYVIDRSFSMANDHALQAAKLELLASLQRLNETQQFQVIFYNNEYVVLNTRGGRFDFFRGTDIQRLMVAEQIREITPAAGTRHLPALLEALNFRPDVIFLLTDGAAESALHVKDLEQIQRQNRYGTHIHCIEFGRAEKSHLGEAGNFLKVLARENAGQYAYHNLKAGF